MSPTSYQTAPPRTKRITQCGGGELRAEGPRDEHMASNSVLPGDWTLWLMFRALLTAYFLALAGVYDLFGVDRIAIDLFFYNFSVFANEKVHPAGGFRLVDVEAVFTGYLSAPIAQQREGYAD